MIRLESVTKSFGEKKVISDLTLEIEKDEIVTLLGPNGCGKTTLLNMLAGLTRPDQGNIYINDVLVSGKEGTKKVYLNPSERKVGYVFQTVSLFPHMRVQDNVAYGLRAIHLRNFRSHRRRAKERTLELLDFVGLRDYARFYPSQLSGGQRQRVALARSLATEPEVLLLDEPVSAVDPQLRESFRLELKEYLQKLKITTVYVTHNLSEAFIMSNRIAVMGNGSIQQIGSGTELFDKPSSGYVASFLGVNSFKGKATKSQGELMQIQANGTLLLAPSKPSLIGKRVTVTIKPENITLSKSACAATDLGTINSMEGVVTEMVQMRSNAQVTLDVGVVLKTRILLSAIKNLGLSVGDKVYVCFTADSLNVFADSDN